jgi:hypothetical protein
MGSGDHEMAGEGRQQLIQLARAVDGAQTRARIGPEEHGC